MKSLNTPLFLFSEVSVFSIKGSIPSDLGPMSMYLSTPSLYPPCLSTNITLVKVRWFQKPQHNNGGRAFPRLCCLFASSFQVNFFQSATMVKVHWLLKTKLLYSSKFRAVQRRFHQIFTTFPGKMKPSQSFSNISISINSSHLNGVANCHQKSVIFNAYCKNSATNKFTFLILRLACRKSELYC